MFKLNPGQALCIEFSDERGVARSEAQVQSAIDDLRAAAQKHGFDLSMSGTPAQMRRFWGKSLATRALDEALEKLNAEEEAQVEAQAEGDSVMPVV